MGDQKTAAWTLEASATGSDKARIMQRRRPTTKKRKAEHTSHIIRANVHRCIIVLTVVYTKTVFVFNDLLSWSDHTSYLVKKMSQQIGFLSWLRSILPPLTIRHLYITCIRPLADYSCVAWSGIGKGDAGRLEKVQRRAARSADHGFAPVQPDLT